MFPEGLLQGWEMVLTPSLGSIPASPCRALLDLGPSCATWGFPACSQPARIPGTEEGRLSSGALSVWPRVLGMTLTHQQSQRTLR